MKFFNKIRHIKRQSRTIVPGLDQNSPLDDPNREALEDRLKHDSQNATTLLREMYGLDIKIWGGRYATDDDDRRRIEEMKHGANARLAEARMIVEGWDSIPRDSCTRDERDLMDSVRKAIQAAGETRYSGKRKR